MSTRPRASHRTTSQHSSAPKVMMFNNSVYYDGARHYVANNGSTMIVNNGGPSVIATPSQPDALQGQGGEWRDFHPCPGAGWRKDGRQHTEEGSADALLDDIGVSKEMGTTTEGSEVGDFHSGDSNKGEIFLGFDRHKTTESQSAFEELGTTGTDSEPKWECTVHTDVSVGESNDEGLEGKSNCDSRGINGDETAEHPCRASDSSTEEYERAPEEESSETTSEQTVVSKDGTVDSEHRLHAVTGDCDCDTTTTLPYAPLDTNWERIALTEGDLDDRIVPSEHTSKGDLPHNSGDDAGKTVPPKTSSLARCNTAMFVAAEEGVSPMTEPSILINVANKNEGLQQSGDSDDSPQDIGDKATAEILTPIVSDPHTSVAADGLDRTTPSNPSPPEERGNVDPQGSAGYDHDLPGIDDSTASEELVVIPVGKANVTKEGGYPVPSEATVEASHGEHLRNSRDVDDPTDSRHVVEAEKDGGVNIIVQDSDAQGELTFIVSAKETDVTEADDWTDLGVTEISPPPVPVRIRGG